MIHLPVYPGSNFSFSCLMLDATPSPCLGPRDSYEESVARIANRMQEINNPSPKLLRHELRVLLPNMLASSSSLFFAPRVHDNGCFQPIFPSRDELFIEVSHNASATSSEKSIDWKPPNQCLEKQTSPGRLLP